MSDCSSHTEDRDDARDATPTPTTRATEGSSSVVAGLAHAQAQARRGGAGGVNGDVGTDDGAAAAAGRGSHAASIIEDPWYVQCSAVQCSAVQYECSRSSRHAPSYIHVSLLPLATRGMCSTARVEI